MGETPDSNSEVGLVVPNPIGETFLTGNDSGEVRLWETPRPLSGNPERVMVWLHLVHGMQLRQRPPEVEGISVATVARFEMPEGDDSHLVALPPSTRGMLNRRLESLGGPVELQSVK